MCDDNEFIQFNPTNIIKPIEIIKTENYPTFPIYIIKQFRTIDCNDIPIYTTFRKGLSNWTARRKSLCNAIFDVDTFISLIDKHYEEYAHLDINIDDLTNYNNYHSEDNKHTIICCSNEDSSLVIAIILDAQ
jgi:hypothetical protein